MAVEAYMDGDGELVVAVTATGPSDLERVNRRAFLEELADTGAVVVPLLMVGLLAVLLGGALLRRPRHPAS